SKRMVPTFLDACLLLLQLLLVEAPGRTSRDLREYPEISTPGWLGEVDQKSFLQYDSNSNKVKPWGFLGETANATKAWTELTQTLREVGQELRMILPVITPENNRSPPTLKVKMCCQCQAEGCTGASWQSSFNGQTTLLSDTRSLNWTVIDPGARGIKRAWEDNLELAEYFRKISMGKHWGEMLKTIVPPLKSPDTTRLHQFYLVAWIIPTIFIRSVLITIITIKVRRRPCTMEGEKQAGL
uniref:MHC class I-like antigen recognition-like domain-containing protein n=1 Tax=Rhinolophus ferrumequinum TaxID=59479 RepID=A0A671FIQ3_RHIFE